MEQSIWTPALQLSVDKHRQRRSHTQDEVHRQGQKNDNDQEAEIMVMNMFGQPMQRTTQLFNQHLQSTLNFSDRDPEGIYWIGVVVDGESFLKPITLNH